MVSEQVGVQQELYTMYTTRMHVRIICGTVLLELLRAPTVDPSGLKLNTCRTLMLTSKRWLKIRDSATVM